MSTHKKRLSDYRMITEKKEMRRRLLFIVIALVSLIALFIIIMSTVLVVKDIIVVGSVTYKENEIIKNSGIKKWQSMFTLSGSETQKKLRNKFPYIKEVMIDRDFPSSVKIIVIEEYTTFYTEFYGEYFLFNYDMRIMDRFDSVEALKKSREGAAEVKMDNIRNALMPGHIEFENEEESGYIKDVIYYLSGCSFVSGLTSIDLTDKYNIKAVYNSNVNIFFGSYDNFALKVGHAEKIMSDATSDPVGSVDVSDITRGYSDISGS